MAKPINTEIGFPDRDPAGSDWLKGAFWDLPTDVDVFMGTVLGGKESEWRHFQSLPVFEAMPPGLRDKVDRRFYGNSKRERAVASRRDVAGDSGSRRET